jgi:hypothetical protein
LCWGVSFCGSSWRFCIWEKEKKTKKIVAAVVTAHPAADVKVGERLRKIKKKEQPIAHFVK